MHNYADANLQPPVRAAAPAAARPGAHVRRAQRPTTAKLECRDDVRQALVLQPLPVQVEDRLTLVVRQIVLPTEGASSWCTLHGNSVGRVCFVGVFSAIYK